MPTLAAETTPLVGMRNQALIGVGHYCAVKLVPAVIAVSHSSSII
jgi:hypothetical protein